MSFGGRIDGRQPPFSAGSEKLLLLSLFLLLPWGDGAMESANLLAVQVLLLLAVSLHLSARLLDDQGAGASEITLIGVALAGVAAVGAVRVVHQVDPYGGWLQLINYLFFGLFYLLHASACRRQPGWAATAVPWLLAGILLAAGHGIWQQLYLHPGRVSGPFRDPNHLASLVTAGAALVLARLVLSTGVGWRRRAWWLLPLVPLVWVLLLTGSRGGVLAFLTVLAAAVLARRLILVLVPLAVSAGLLLIPNPFLTYLKSLASADPYALERIGIWRSALEMIAANPLGVGLGNYGLYSAMHNFPVEQTVARFGRMPQQAHNIPLHLVAEGGWLTTVPLALLLAALLAVLLRYRQRRSTAGHDPAAAGALLGLLGLGVQAMVSKNLGNTALCCIMLFFLAVLGDLSPKAVLPAPRFSRWPAAPRKTLAWVLAALVFWFAAWVPYHGQQLSRAAARQRAAGEPAGAAALLQRAIRAVPIQSYYHARLAALHGEQFLRTGDLEAMASAVRIYDQAIDLNPRQPSFREARAALFLQFARSRSGPLGDEAWQEARRGYLKALQLDPYRFPVRWILAGMSVERDDPVSAILQLERAVADEPNFIRGRLMLAGLLEGQGRAAAAQEQRRQAAERRLLYPEPLPGWGAYERELLRTP
jgi:O-antigen ligase